MPPARGRRRTTSAGRCHEVARGRCITGLRLMPVRGHTALSAAKWVRTITGVIGAIIIAANLGMVVSGFAFFLVSSLLWSTVGWVQREVSLLVLQGTFTVINVIGIWRWVGA